MHIIQIYHAPVPVSRYGGMERVIEALCLGFIEMGHKVTLMSYRGDYTIPGVNSIYFEDHFNYKNQATSLFPKLIPNDADILHFHVPYQYPTLDIPYITTMHGNIRDDEDPKDLPSNIVFISKKHALNHGSNKNNFIYNGLIANDIPISPIDLKDRKYFAFLGRASLKRKGLKNAKVIAKKLGHPLHIGGGSGFNFIFNNHKFLGQLNNNQKFQLLGNAISLLFPISWEEPFGLVMIEAMFSGTSVWGFNRGSVPEILSLDKRGKELFISANELNEMIDLGNNFLNTKHSVDFCHEIRKYAEDHFGHIKMCKEYLKRYSLTLLSI